MSLETNEIFFVLLFSHSFWSNSFIPAFKQPATAIIALNLLTSDCDKVHENVQARKFRIGICTSAPTGTTRGIISWWSWQWDERALMSEIKHCRKMWSRFFYETCAQCRAITFDFFKKRCSGEAPETVETFRAGHHYITNTFLWPNEIQL